MCVHHQAFVHVLSCTPLDMQESTWVVRTGSVSRTGYRKPYIFCKPNMKVPDFFLQINMQLQKSSENIKHPAASKDTIKKHPCPPIIKHGNGKFSIHGWFSHWNLHLQKISHDFPLPFLITGGYIIFASEAGRVSTVYVKPSKLWCCSTSGAGFFHDGTSTSWRCTQYVYYIYIYMFVYSFMCLHIVYIHVCVRTCVHVLFKV